MYSVGKCQLCGDVVAIQVPERLVPSMKEALQQRISTTKLVHAFHRCEGHEKLLPSGFVDPMGIVEHIDNMQYDDLLSLEDMNIKGE